MNQEPTSGSIDSSFTHGRKHHIVKGTYTLIPNDSIVAFQYGKLKSQGKSRMKGPIGDSAQNVVNDTELASDPPKQDGGGPNSQNPQEVEQTGDPMDERKLSQAKLNDVLASINTTYLEEAAKEDKELVDSWTETLNIILTFGGLLSAVITAFLLVMQPDLKPDPNESTNQILIRILQRLDNSTNLGPSVDESYIPSDSTLRCLTWWHTSLGCSLTSTFGALLSKLWVLHYQNNPRWADTEMKRSRLRESRFDGLEKWKMYAIIESLPVILQLAVFLFYLGLAESLRSTPTLFAVTVSFAAIMGALFVLTLLTGAFFPSCPYKSTLSSFVNQAVGDVGFWSGGGIITVGGVISLALSRAFKRDLDSVWVEVKRYWDGRMTSRVVGGLEYGRGERSLVEEAGYSAGVLCWWLQAPHLWSKIEADYLDDVIDAVMRKPVDAVMDTRRWKGNFQVWSLRVFAQLRDDKPSRSDRLQADMVCHFMHHSSDADASTKLAISNGQHNSPHYDTADVYICKAIRHGWIRSLQGPVESTTLPVAKMYPTTYSVYLRHQLSSWGNGDQENRWNSELLIKELPDALKPDYFNLDSDNPKDPLVFLSSIIDAISLAAIALVSTDSNPNMHSANVIVSSEPLEQLLKAIHRLSFFPEDIVIPDEKLGSQSGDGTLQKQDIEHRKQLVAAAVSGAYRVFEKSTEKELYDSPSWVNGAFAGSLSRLLRLGHTWWHSEPNKGPGTDLVQHLHRWVSKLPRSEVNADFMAGIGKKVLLPGQDDYSSPEEVISLDPDIVREALATYAHPSTHEASHTAARALDHVLGLRFYQHSTHHITSFLRDPTLSRIPPPISTLELPAHITRQLIDSIRNSDHRIRHLSLSIIVKARDIFLPPSPSISPPQLKDALESLFDSMHTPEKVLQILPGQAYGAFSLWNELQIAIETQVKQIALSQENIPGDELSPGPPGN